MARSVIAPDRVRWQVGRKWIPARVRMRDIVDWRDLGPGDVADLGLFDSPGAVVVGLAAVATAMLLFLVIWPIVAIALEVVLLVVLFVTAIVDRLTFRRPWTVYARSQSSGTPQQHTWQVVGWRASKRLIEDVIEALESGAQRPPGASTAGPRPVPIPQSRDGAV